MWKGEKAVERFLATGEHQGIAVTFDQRFIRGSYQLLSTSQPVMNHSAASYNYVVAGFVP